MKNLILMGIFSTLLAACLPSKQGSAAPSAPADESKPSTSAAKSANPATGMAVIGKASYDKEIILHENPNAKAYRLKVEIKNAPGSLVLQDANMIYSVQNQPCLPRRSEPLVGGQIRLDEILPIQLEKTGDFSYSGVAKIIAILNEDYFGLGVCQWQFDSLTIDFKATGKVGETLFGATLHREDLTSGREKVLYYWKEFYPGNDGVPTSGLKNLNIINDGNRDKFFTITLKIEEINP